MYGTLGGHLTHPLFPDAVHISPLTNHEISNLFANIRRSQRANPLDYRYAAKQKFNRLFDDNPWLSDTFAIPFLVQDYLPKVVQILLEEIRKGMANCAGPKWALHLP